MSFGNCEDVEERHNMGGGSDWFKIKEGDNRVRFLSNPVPIAKYFNRQTSTSYVLEEFNAPDEFQGAKKSIRYICWLWDRDDDSLKIAEFPYTIIKFVNELQKDEDWKFDELPEYDVVIKKTGSGLETKYSVVPSPKRDEVSKDVLSDFESESSAEEVAQKMIDKSNKSICESQEAVFDDVPPPEEPDFLNS